MECQNKTELTKDKPKHDDTNNLANSYINQYSEIHINNKQAWMDVRHD